ncbi:MAG: hypothetical protein ABJ242_10475 [Marinomonas sp.]
MSRSAYSLPASADAILRASKGVKPAVMTSSDGADVRQSRKWRPGLADPAQHPCHNEIFARSDGASGAGLVLALACDALAIEAKGPLTCADDQRHILWVQTRDAIKRAGRPYVHGLPPELRRRLIHVAADTAQDALFALEEGVRCRDLAFVVGEILGDPRELDFTASRRLTLAAQRHGSRLYLLRLDAKPDLSSARMRWNAASAPSNTPRWNADAPGNPAWTAELFRARSHPIGKWILHNDKGELSVRKPTKRFSEYSKSPFIIPRAANAAKAGVSPNYGNMARATVGRSLAAL